MNKDIDPNYLRKLQI